MAMVPGMPWWILRPMTFLDELTVESRPKGLTASGAVTILRAEWHLSGAVTLTLCDDASGARQKIVYRDGERLSQTGRPGRAPMTPTAPCPSRLLSAQWRAPGFRLGRCHLVDERGRQ
jgi:hypothetical protein